MGTNYTVDSSGNLTTTGSITSTSTTSGFLLPKLTTTQRNLIASPATGLEIFNITTNQIEFYNGTIWTAVGGGGGGTITGSGTTNVIPVFTGSTAVGNSGITDLGNGSTLTIASRLFNVNFPGSVQNPTSQYMQKLHSTSVGANTNIYTYLDFRAAASYASATAIGTIGAGSNGGAEFLISGVGFSNGALGFCDKVLVCVQGNTATVLLMGKTSVGSGTFDTGRTYTATASGGTGTLNLQLVGNAATFQVHIKMVVIGAF